MERRATQLNPRTLKILAWRAGHHGVSGLARHLGRSRETLHRAVRNPERYGPTVAAIKAAFGIPE
jgi:hypothetical protein